jgi:hypothetical protein
VRGGGATWSNWATFNKSTTGHTYSLPRILVAEGGEDRVFVAYTHDSGSGVPTELHVASPSLPAQVRAGAAPPP